MTTYNDTLTEDVNGLDTETNVFLQSPSITDAASGQDTATYIAAKVALLVDNIEALDSLIPELRWFVVDGMSASDTITISSVLHGAITEGIDISAIIQLLFLISINEDLDFSDTPLLVKGNVVLLNDLITKSDSLLSSLQANETLIEEGLFVLDTNLRGFAGAIIDAIQVSTEQLVTLLSNNLISEGVEISDDLIRQVVLNLTLEDLADISDAQSVAGIFSNSLLEYITFSLEFPDDDSSYYGWTYSPENKAVTNYNLNFSEATSYKEQTFLANSSGLYLMEGTRDEGEYIKSKITTAGITFGKRVEKQIPQVFFGVSGTRHIVTVSVDGGKTVYYEMIARPEDGLVTKTLKIGKGLIGNTWQFSLIDKNQDDFDLDSIEFFPVFLKRKHR